MGSQPVSMALRSIVGAFILSGCSSKTALQDVASLRQPLISAKDTCSKILTSTQNAISLARVRDSEAVAVAGFPYLRVNRFLARLGTRFRGRERDPAFDAWVARLRRLDDESKNIEIMNLPASDRIRLLKLLPGRARTVDGLVRRIGECADKSQRMVLANPARRIDLLERAMVPDSYSGVARAAGAYPLMAIPVSQGWNRWRQENLGTFELQAAHLPVTGELLEFTPRRHTGALSAKEVRQITERSRDTLLGIPEPQGTDLARLLAAFAPVWQIDITGDYDRIGHPMWTYSPREIKIDHRRPTAFTRVSHVIVNNRVLLQLVYGIWFQERPLDGPLDLLGGKLDSVIWRVTFGEDGRPVMYDSIHACGCYHLFFPVSTLRKKRAPNELEILYEKPAILRSAPDLRPGKHLVLRIATRSHYLNQVSLAGGHNKTAKRIFHDFADDAKLRSLPLPKGSHRSLFDEDGLIAESERLERYLLWPMGIASAGAMRQWGHHATAFVGKRHFDDPELIEKLFYR